jgi:voltage-gated sodium channel
VNRWRFLNLPARMTIPWIHLTDRIVRSAWFQHTILLAILVAGILAGIETNAAMVASYGTELRTLDRVILGIFVIEIVLKLAANYPRPWNHFRDGWNVFDFLVVVLCLLPMPSQFAVVLRMVRTLRVLRLISALPKLQLLVGALIKSFSSMGYVGLLLSLMLYIYAVAGVHLFGEHDPAHFGSLSLALFTLFQTITLDDWKFLFESAQGDAPVIAAVYFVSFILLGTMIMLNLFIGIIMNSMEEMHSDLGASKTSHNSAPSETDVLHDLAELDAQVTMLKHHTSRLRAHWEQKVD